MCCLFLYNGQCIGFVCKASTTINTHELYYNIKVARVSLGNKKVCGTALTESWL